MPEISPRAALRDVDRATKARRRLAADGAEAQEQQATAIRIALEVGVTVAELATVTGLTAARIYQIKEGRR